MIYVIKRSLLVISCFVFLGTLQVAENKPLFSVIEGIQNDTLLTKTFGSKNELSLYIAEELNLTETTSFSDRREVDSLHLLLNESKQLLIGKSELIKFIAFSVANPVPKKVVAQTVKLSHKDKIQRLSLEVNQGDSLTLEYVVEKGIGSAGFIEVLLNQVRVAEAVSVKRGKRINLHFKASEKGLVEIIIRNVGLLKESGNIEVFVTPQIEQVQIKKIRTVQVKKELMDTLVQDTLFQTVVDSEVVLTNRSNLKGSFLLQKQIDFIPENEFLGFGVFVFPSSEKEKLQFSRKETYREDPLEDFSLKELIGKSFTYLPEFAFPELIISLSDMKRKLLWSSGDETASGGWRMSPNSKSNYVFFQAMQPSVEKSFNLKFSNSSDLYDLDFGLKIITLFIKKFTVKQEIEIKEFKETILLTLL